MSSLALTSLILLSSAVPTADPAATFRAELVFPLRSEHNHAPGIVECPNGDLLASWYRGSGERQSDDVAVYGARLRKGEAEWSETYLMADFPGFPDCNTCMMIDRHNKLWLFWPIIIANTWESAITQFKVSSDYMGEGCPKWEREGAIYLKPDDFKDEALKHLDDEIAKMSKALTPEQREYFKNRSKYFDVFRERLGDKMYQRFGWQTRCKPIILPTGRILLPLYSDTYSLGLMAVSDDDGRNWYASKPLMGFGAIQPALARRDDGTIVAYMRENGPKDHIRVCESKDDGITWGPVTESELPNPGSGLDVVRLANGHFCLIYNDAVRGRNSLAVSISDDEGKTWKWTRHLEKQPAGSYHYPAIIQGKEGTIHAIYSYFSVKEDKKEGKSMKHAAFDEAWVMQGD